MYLFGGRATNNIDGDLNDMLILDTINLSWGKGSLINAPTPRRNYGATLLPNNNIYIGKFSFLTMTSGAITSKRDAFSAVLGVDGTGYENSNDSDVLFLDIGIMIYISGQMPLIPHPFH
ncbi:hypothetical protein RclHR1_00060035 [Rhizophagus clarus]|uniref:Uncharacterized protein n=1 Tax=Rhizophagus clarus TaxID=94130 RepID=A0A2Z6S8B4_9GLOM|nr:hypothetical protein RclHR1_00060035 [Rhizophagus clarus]